MCGGAAQNHHRNYEQFYQDREWRCLLLRIVLQDAFNEVLKVYAPMTVRVFVDDIDIAVSREREEL